MLEAYRSRLQERLQKTLAEFEVALDPADVIKEVSLFADRADISEEIVRLRSHLDQFGATLALPESSGRKLEFLDPGDVPRSQYDRLEGQRRGNRPAE